MKSSHCSIPAGKPSRLEGSSLEVAEAALSGSLVEDLEDISLRVIMGKCALRNGIVEVELNVRLGKCIVLAFPSMHVWPK